MKEAVLATVTIENKELDQLTSTNWKEIKTAVDI